MFLYFIIVIALLSTLLFITAIFADYINSKLNYYGNKDEYDVAKAKYKIVLSIFMSLSWGYIIYVIIK